MISYWVIYPFCRLVFGTLYPAYASYKAVRTKNLKEYVKWMMYWIVFALFTCTETFTDVFLSWFPFYYEVKIVLVLWLLSPATKGSSILYRKFVHPALCRREQEIDEYIAKAKDQGYHTVLNLGTKGVNYATTVIMQTAIKGGGGLVQQLRKSYSLSDLSECDPRDERGADEADDVLTEPRLIRRATAKSGYNTRRSASESNSRSAIYFPEVDVDLKSGRRCEEPNFSHIKSNEDISSGYSSADNSASLTRTASVGAAQRAKARTTRTTVTTIKRPQAAEDNEVIIEELHDDEFDYTNMPALLNLPSQLYLSNTDPPFIYQCVGNQIKIVQVLGNTSSNTSERVYNDNDQWDQNNSSFEDASPIMDTIDNQKTEQSNDIADIEIKDCYTKNNVSKDKSVEMVENKTNIVPIIGIEEDENAESSVFVSNVELKTVKESDTADIRPNVDDADSNTTTIDKVEEPKQSQNVCVTVTEDPIESTSLDTSFNDVDSMDSDDEASFGTPEDSPKTKRRSPKGRYGKSKAPPPPPAKSENFETTIDVKEQTDNILTDTLSTTSQESLVDIVNNLPNNSLKEKGTSKGLQVVNPIAEKKRRHKSKSPGRIPKGSSSSIGKLLQLPGKFAFWNKTDDKNKDNASTSSEDKSSSQRSSSNEKRIDESQCCNKLNDAQNDASIEQISLKESEDEKQQTEGAEDQLSFKDASDFESEAISHEVMEKSDALQKLIDAKIESHPEYKIVSLHEEILTTSKSTDV
ncbi:dentin sialophosphoprotein isoform X4 [Hyposmocoma kahamanoa]|nr:dentin sialophosphoprotein isoform X4 [Hyposmocoma kahamanoa]